jgi:uncharacterized protein involved in exopolysaccharide biosynthesis
MTNEYPPISPATPAVSANRERKLRYLALALAANLSIWSVVLLLLKDAPRVYASQWSVMFLGRTPKPGADAGSAGNRTLTFASNPSDPKATYQVIATTELVRKTAAAKLSMTTEQFGKPDVKVIPGTELMHFTMTGSTREEAQKKAYALNEAFQDRLHQLRMQQAEMQETAFENSLDIAKKRLEAAQFRLSDYKVRAGLASKDQIDELASNIETLRRLRAEAAAQQQEASIRSRQLATDLNLSSHQAANAFTLRSDSLFQQYLREYSAATTTLTNVSTKFGPNHPIVLRESARQSAAQTALLERGAALLGQPVDMAAIARLNLSGDSQATTPRESLFKDVVTNNLERQGLAARVLELDRQLYQLEQRLNILAQRNSTLDALNRDMQIAEAVFSAQLKELNAGSLNILDFYPPVQMIADPTLPEQGRIPRQKTYLISAAIASLGTTAVLLLLYLRKTPPGRKWLQKYTSFNRF